VVVVVVVVVVTVAVTVAVVVVVVSGGQMSAMVVFGEAAVRGGGGGGGKCSVTSARSPSHDLRHRTPNERRPVVPRCQSPPQMNGARPPGRRHEYRIIGTTVMNSMRRDVDNAKTRPRSVI